MQEIRSDSELKRVTDKILEDVVENVSKEVLEMLIEYIDKYVYGSNPKPNKIYHDKSRQPTYEFREAFRWDDMKKALKEITRELLYDPSNMRHDAETYLHGSSVSGDVTSYLNKILNEPQSSGFTSRWKWKRTQPYWSFLMEDLFGGELDSMFDRAFSKYGIRRI